MKADLTGKTAVVYAASEGVGPGVVEALAEAGARVVAAPAQADPVAFLDRAGPVDILVVSARPVRNKPLLETGADELRAVIDEDLVRPARFMQEAARRMAARGSGRIIVFASMSAKTGVHHNVAPFAAAKGGLLAFARVMAAELAAKGVTVNGIATALFEPQAATMAPEKRERLRGEIPVGRFGRPREAAHAVLFLAADDGAFVTGETLNLSGGRFMD